jgi:hypothetical protein
MNNKSAVICAIMILLLGLASCKKSNDNQLTEEVKQKISADSGLRDKPIDVQAAAGVVTLSGTVEDITQWNAAAAHASSVKGVKQVVNNLQVTEPTDASQRQPVQQPPALQQPTQQKQATPTQSAKAALPDAPSAAAPAPPQRNPIPPGTPTPDVIHQKIGAFVYPAKNQLQDQQQYDEMDCYNWAKSQTSIDPMGPPTPVQQVEKGDNQAKGARLGGAARGAAGGAVVGAIAGDAGKGAAIGATVGTMRGGRAVRQGKAQAEQDYQQAQVQAQQQAAATDKQKTATFKKAFAVCVQGRGYSVQ